VWEAAPDYGIVTTKNEIGCPSVAAAAYCGAREWISTQNQPSHKYVLVPLRRTTTTQPTLTRTVSQQTNKQTNKQQREG